MSDIEKISQFAAAMLDAAEIDDLLWSIAQNVGHILGFDDCVVYLRDGDNMVQKAAYGIKNPKGRNLLNEIIIPVGSGIVGTVALTQVSEIVADTSTDKRYIRDEFSGKSELTVPVIYENHVIAILDSESASLNGFCETDKIMLQTIANIAAPRIASAQYCEMLRATQRELQQSNRDLKDSLDHIKASQEKLVHTEKMASVGLLSTGIAHEINNPLSYSLSNISYVREQLENIFHDEQNNTADARQVLRDIDEALADGENGLHRIKRIIRDLTCYARVNGTSSQRVDINDSIRSAMKLVVGGGSSHCDLSLELAQVPSIVVDNSKIQQVLINLMMNAQYAAGDAGKILVKSYATSGHVCFEVTDNGPGIEQQNITNIFTPFFTTKPVGEGTGLGLFICYKIIKEEYSGSIDVYSDHHNTTFCVRLPAR